MGEGKGMLQRRHYVFALFIQCPVPLVFLSVRKHMGGISMKFAGSIHYHQHIK